MSNGHAAFKLVLFSKTLEGCYPMSNGHAAFKLGLTFSKTLEGCYPMSNVMPPSNLSYLVKLWKAVTLCLMVMQPSNLAARLHPSFIQ